MWHVWGTGKLHTGFLFNRPYEKRPLGRPWCKWENNIKMDVQAVVWGGVDWIDQGHDRHVAGLCECGNEPSG
jgi:hypothetical protein